MSQILNEIKLDYKITTREEVHVTITGIPTHIHHLPDGEEMRVHSYSRSIASRGIGKSNCGTRANSR
jgi:hypothetical protein